MFDIRDELEQVTAQLRESYLAQRRRAIAEQRNADEKLDQLDRRLYNEKQRYPVLTADEAAAQRAKRNA